MEAFSLSPSSTEAVNTRSGSPLPSSRRRPSGAASAHSTVIEVAPRPVSSPQQATSDPPVASIGSSTNTSRSTRDAGSEAMYASGWKVTSLRASPTKPIWDSGSIPWAVSAMPSPARSTGTISGGLGQPQPAARQGHNRGRAAQPEADRVGDRRADRLLGDLQVAGGLVHQHL